MDSGRVDIHQSQGLFINAGSANDDEITFVETEQFSGIYGNGFALAICKPNRNGRRFVQLLLAEWTTIRSQIATLPWLS